MKDLLSVEILLVEDNKDHADLAIRALKNCNLANRLVHVNNGESALDFIFSRGEFDDETGTKTPRLVMLDHKLPGIQAMEVLRTLKSDDRTKTIPVVMLTSTHDEEERREGYSLGVNSFVKKPDTIDEYLETVSRVGTYWVLMNSKPN